LEGNRNTVEVLIRKLEEKRPVSKSSRRHNGNINWNFRIYGGREDIG
jgi:hypothetical protein